MPGTQSWKSTASLYRRAIALRRELAPLRRGDFRCISAERGSGLFAFSREYGGERVYVAVNCSDRAEKCALPGEKLWTEGLEADKIGPYGFAVTVLRG